MLSKMVPVPCIKVADLGCASGPNTFFPTCEIVDIVTRIYREAHCESPELQMFLNDLPQNDFNTVFKSVPSFNGRPYFIAGVTGSFYQRLFPSNNVHFVHSSYCLHWLLKKKSTTEDKAIPRGHLKDMLSKMVHVPCIKVADLGCASGPNTFFSTCEVMDIIASVCR
ncbi:hypothetical protein GOBAR_AA37688 [Gossypium barbadense]|uniref:Uncharacterized protein n=1 Tax=Gossypium barbadense TaxID=3634 RepID=A0A2P5VW00_GOSBA|nr:hypothetical protein GOBAR_AA37688 [Gossypium barbadense]